MATFADIASSPVATLYSAKFKKMDTPYAEMATKIWTTSGTTNKAKTPNNVEMFTDLQNGRIKKPQFNTEWEALAPIFPNYSMFALFMMLHRRKPGPEWATLNDGFELLYHLTTEGNYRTRLRWNEVSSNSGLVSAGTKTGNPYTGKDPIIKKMSEYMQVGFLGNTLFSQSKVLLGGLNSKRSAGDIFNLIPGIMQQPLDWKAMGFPPFGSRSTPELIDQVRQVLLKYSDPEVDLKEFLEPIPSEKITLTSKAAKKPTIVTDYSELPDL